MVSKASVRWVWVLCIPALCGAQETAPRFPVKPEVFVDGRFEGAEGIAFDGGGKLYVTADRALWELDNDGGATMVVEGLHTTVGIAGVGASDILIADFGPTNAFQHGPNDDGMLWRVSPGETKRLFATGMGDPNFIVVREDGSLLVSDDGTDEIFLVSAQGETRLWSRAVSFPNGMVLSADGRSLFVAQIFKSLGPVVFDDALWRMPLEDGEPDGDAELVFRTGGVGGNDGLAMDSEGRIYVAENQAGRIWRVDPGDGASILITQDVMNAGSLVFGEGAFDREALYVTQVRGGRVWKVPVGVTGMPVTR